jgi:hypothetical protein
MAATAGSEEASIFTACTMVWRWFSVHGSVKPRPPAKVSVVVFSVQGRYGRILDGKGIKSDSRGLFVEGQTGTFVSTEREV